MHIHLIRGAILMTTGVYAGTPILATWIANNSELHYWRATSLALLAIIGNAVCFTIISKFIISSIHFLSFRVAFWLSGAF